LTSDEILGDGEKGKTDLLDNMMRSLRRAKQGAYDIVHNNTWDYFVTITFNGQVVDRYNYESVAKKLSQTLKNIKKRQAKQLQYIFVPECHKDGAIHFHGLINGVEGLEIYDSGKKDSTRRKIYKSDEFEKLGFTDLSEIRDSSKAGTYILKYMTKSMGFQLEGKKYWASRGLNELEVHHIMIGNIEQKKELIEDLFASGTVVSHLRRDIETDEFANSYTYIVTQPSLAV
jgi:hypothetical protein